MKLTTKKSTFKLVPEGDIELQVTNVSVKPQGNPQVVEFNYSHKGGGTIKETMELNKEIVQQILGKRVDVALGGDVPEGTEFDIFDVVPMFQGKSVIAHVEHNVVEKNGEKRTYANIKYITDVFGGEEEDDDL